MEIVRQVSSNIVNERIPLSALDTNVLKSFCVSSGATSKLPCTRLLERTVNIGNTVSQYHNLSIVCLYFFLYDFLCMF